MSFRLPPGSGIEGYAWAPSQLVTGVRELGKRTTIQMLFLEGISEGLPSELRPCLVFDIAVDFALDEERAILMLKSGELADPGPYFLVKEEPNQPTSYQLGHFNLPLWSEIVERRCKGNRLGVVPLSIERRRQTQTGAEGEGHFNILLIDPRDRTVERYEPNGPAENFYNTEELDRQLRAYIEPHGYRYIAPLEACPKEESESLLAFYHAQISFPPAMKPFASGGYCVAFALFYAVLRALNPDMSREAVLRYLTDLDPKKRILMVMKFWTEGLRRLQSQYGSLPVIEGRVQPIRFENREDRTVLVVPTAAGQDVELSFEDAKRAHLLTPELRREFRRRKV